ncbi:hypothetical protein [Actinoplanes sp. NPDC049681]|uniref:hypothetical protein n=1 Tax=Actinoplanes sp. NPDC049681 TaxID=3363905 RepID=UPI0037B09B18
MSEGEFHAYIGLLFISGLVLSVLAVRGFGLSTGARVVDGLFSVGFLGYAVYLVVAEPDEFWVFYYAFAAPIWAVVHVRRSHKAARAARFAAFTAQPARHSAGFPQAAAQAGGYGTGFPPPPAAAQAGGYGTGFPPPPAAAQPVGYGTGFPPPPAAAQAGGYGAGFAPEGSQPVGYGAGFPPPPAAQQPVAADGAYPVHGMAAPYPGAESAGPAPVAPYGSYQDLPSGLPGAVPPAPVSATYEPTHAANQYPAPGTYEGYPQHAAGEHGTPGHWQSYGV